MATIIASDPAGDAGMDGVQPRFREPTLKLCPFCNSDELSHGYSYPPEQGVVQCHACGGAMIADSEADAISAWNTRAESQT